MRNRWWRVAAAGVLLLGAWVAVDLSSSGRHDLTEFDPHSVARLETAMWKSYYAHERLRLFGQLAGLLRTQYRLPLWSSTVGAYYSARAAATFQGGHSRADYQRAMPYLIRFYALIRKGSSVPFSVEDVAALELEWWIVHRERARHRPGELEQALARLQAAIYRMPEAGFAEHAKARAEAMVVCDAGNAAGLVPEADWIRIEAMLDRSWGSLREVVSRR